MSWVLCEKRKSKKAEVDRGITVGLYPQKNTTLAIVTISADMAKTLDLGKGAPFLLYMQQVNGKPTGRVRIARFEGEASKAERFARAVGTKSQIAFSIPGKTHRPSANVEYQVYGKTLQLDLNKIGEPTARAKRLAEGVKRKYTKRSDYWKGFAEIQEAN